MFIQDVFHLLLNDTLGHLVKVQHRYSDMSYSNVAVAVVAVVVAPPSVGLAIDVASTVSGVVMVVGSVAVAGPHIAGFI